MSAEPTFDVQTGLTIEQAGALWRELQLRADGGIFLSWLWISSWLQELGEVPPLFVGTAAGRTVLLGFLLPSSRKAVRLIRFDGLQLHTTGQWEQDCIAIEYNGFLVDRDWAGRVERSAFAWLLRGHQVAGVRPAEVHILSMLEEHRTAWTPDSATYRIPFRKPSWRVDLDSLRARGSDYLSSLRPNTRQQIRRSMRLYDVAGGLSATWADSAETGLRFLDGLKTLHQNQWNARGKPGGFASAFFERFQRRLIAEALPAGAAELVQITRGDEPIGYLYNLVWQGYVHAFVSGIFFEDDNRLKPGLVCHALCIQHHLDTGASVYDFMAGDFRYKASLGEPGPDFIYLLLQRRTLAAWAEASMYRARDRLRT